MIAQTWTFQKGETKLIERLVADQNLHINHMIIPMGDRVPLHQANSNAYLIILRGQMNIRLEAVDSVVEAGHIIAVPVGTTMDIRNESEAVLEFFVVKAPAPGAER